MKLTFPSAFQKTKKCAPAESRDALPQYSFGFRAMALLTASLVFLQGPMAIAATNIWTGKGDGVSLLDSDNWSTLDVVSSDTLKFVPRGSAALGIGSITALPVNLQGSATAFGIAVGDARTDSASSITIAGGTLTLGSNGSDGIGFTDVGGFARKLEVSSTLKVAAAQNINVNLAADSVILSGNISSTPGIANTRFSKSGMGALELSGDNSGFTGGVSMGAGVLVLNSATALGSGSLEILGGGIDNTSLATVVLTTNNVQFWNGDFTYIGSQGRVLNVGTGEVTLGDNRNVTVAAGEFAVGGIIGGTYSLTKAGAGALTLSGANTFDGGLTLSAGQINFNNDAAAGTGILTIQGGSIDNTSSSAVTLTAASQVWNSGFTYIGTRALNTGAGNITLSAGTVLTIQGGVFTVGGALSGTASITKAGAGKLQLEAAAAYTGSTTVTGGTLSTNAANLLPNSTDVTIDAGAALELGGDQTVASLKGAGNLANAGVLVLSNGSSNSLSGVLSGTGSLTLVTGAMTLSGANTYSGNTELQSGAILKIGNSAALGSAAGFTDVLEGATLDLNGQTGVQEALTVSGTGSANAGALVNTSASPASLAGLVTLAGSSSIGGSGNLTLSGGIAEDTAPSNLTKIGSGRLILDGSSSFTGATNVAAGVLRVGNANALGSGATKTSGVYVTAGAAMDLYGNTSAVNVDLFLNGAGILSDGALVNTGLSAAYGGNITLESDSAISGGITLSGDINGANVLTKVGAGSLVLTGTSNTAASFVVAEGALSVGDNQTTGTLGSGSVEIKPVASLIFNRSDSYGGSINNELSGSGNVTVASGTLTLSGANTYTGITRLLNGSSLILGSTSALGASSEARVEAGALLDLNGNNSSVNLAIDGRSNSVAALSNSGALVTYGGLVSLATGTVSAIGGTGDIILSRAVSGGTLAKVGANTLTLDAASNYGKTSVDSGALKLTGTGSFGTEEVQVNTGAQIIFARTDASVVDKSISGEGTVSIEAGTLTLTGANTYTGATTVAGATLSIGDGGANGSITSSIDLDAASSLKFNLNVDSNYGGVLTGQGTLTKLGAGTLSLSGASNFSGSTVVSQGLLSVGSGGATGELQGNIEVAAQAAIQFNRTGTLSYSEVISGSGSVSNIGSGAVTLAGTQTYFGATNVSAGSLLADTLLNTTNISVSETGALTAGSFNSSAQLNISGTGAVTVTGTGLSLAQLTNNSAAATGLNFTGVTDAITVAGLSGTGATSFASDATIGGAISAGSITVAGLLTVTDVSGGALTTQTLTATGTITGGAIAASGDATIERVSAGSLTLGGATNTVTELLGGTFNFTNAAAAFNVTGGNQDATGVISGSANLTSAGNLTLNGENTYTRGTALTGGTLTVGGTSALGSGELVVTSGASLDASTAGARIANQISLGGELNFRGSNSLTAQGSLVLSAPSSLNVAAQSLTLSGSIAAGASALTKEGVGTLALTGTNSDVALVINAGVVTAGTSALSTSATVTTASPGTFSLLGNQSIDTLNGSGTLLLGSSSLTLGNGGSFSGVISGNQESFLNLTAGNLTISGNSPAFDGTLSVNGGVVDLDQTTQRVGSAILNGGTIQNGTLDFSRLTLSSGSYNATLSGQGDLIKDSTAQTVSLGADNSAFTGIAVIQGGTLALENTSALTSAVRVIFDPNVGSATLRVGTSNVTISSLDSFGSNGSQGIVAMGTNTLTLQGQGGYSRFDGSITSAAGGSLVLAGLGTQVLAGDSTGATFRTVVQSGVLEIANELALGSTVNEIALSGGTLSINAFGALAARHNLTSTGTSLLTLRGQASQTLGALSLDGTIVIDGAEAGPIQAIAFEDTTLANASTINVGSYASVSVGNLTGSHDLTKSGNGSLTLTAGNNSTAATTVNGGSLILAPSAVLASGNLTVDGTGAVLDLGSTPQTVGAVSVTSGAVQGGTLEGASFSLNNATISAQLIGSGALTSSGATTLSGQNTYTGGTTVNSGSLTVTNTGSLSASGSLAVSQGAYANFLGTNVTIGSISGVGTTAFSGAANITEALTEGVVTVNGDANLAGGVAGGTVTVGGAANSALSGGALTLNGSGSTLTTMTGGSLTLAADKTATVTTFTDGNASIAGSLQVNAGTFIGTLGGAGSVGVSNAGSVSLNGNLTAFTGAYTVAEVGSTLSIGSATSDQASLALVSGGTANLNFDGGSLRAVANDGRLVLTSGTISLGSLTGNGIVSASGPTNLKVGISGDFGIPPVFSGSLTGGIALTKEGGSVVVLSGSSDYTGGTTVSQGLLVAGSSLALSTGSIVVMSGASLGLEQGSTLSNSILLDGTSGFEQPARLSSFQGNNVVSSTLRFSGRADIELMGGSLLTGSISVAQGTDARLRFIGNTGSSITVGGSIALGSDGLLEVRDTSLTLLGSVTGREVRIEGASASLYTDIDANLDLGFGASVNLENSLSVSSLSSQQGTTLNLDGNGLTVLDGQDRTAAGGIVGSGALTLGSGSLTLAGNNSYTGGTTVTNGFLTVSGNLAAGGGLDINAGTVHFASPTELGAVANNGRLVFGSNGSITSLVGTGNTELTGGVALSVSNLTGGSFTTAQGSVLDVTNGVFGGTISGVGSVNTTGVLRINEGATMSDTLRYSVSASGSLTFAGNKTVEALENLGDVTFSGNGNVTNLSGSGTTGFASDLTVGNYTGSGRLDRINGGTGSLSFGTVNGTGVTTLGGDASISELLGGAINLVSPGVLSISSGSSAGVISGQASLVKVGGGTLTLSGANTYTGLTTVQGGLLSITGSLAEGSDLTISSGTVAFANAAGLGEVTNAGLLRFDSSVTMSSLTGDGRTEFAGGVSLGAVTGGTLTIATANTVASNNVGALSNVTLNVTQQTTVTAASFAGTTATVDGILNITGAMNGGQVTNNGVVSVGNLTGGSFTTAQGSVLNVANGVFGGTISGVGSVNTTGAFNILSSATLGSSLSYSVAPQGALTFDDARNIGTLESNGSTTFANGGSLSTQTGVGRVSVSASTLTVERGLDGMLTVGSLAAAVYTQSATLSDVDNRGTLTLPSGSTVTTINSVGTLTHSGTLTINGGGTISALSGGASTSLTKTGQATLTLGGAYLGSTVVSQGTLSLSAGALLSGDVKVDGGRLVLGGTNQLGANLTLTAGVVDLGGYAQLMVGTFSTSGGILGLPGENATLTASSLNITGGAQNAVTLLSGTGSQSFTGTLTIPQIGKSGMSNSVELTGVNASVSTGAIFAPSVTIGGSSNLLVVSGGSAVSMTETAAITIGGEQNTLEFTQGFAPQGALVLVVGDSNSQGSTLRVHEAGLVLGGSQTLKGKGTVDGDVTLGAGATFAPGNSPGIFTVTGSVSIAPGASTAFEYTAEKLVNVGSGAADRLDAGALPVFGGSVSAIAVGGPLSTGTSRVNRVGSSQLPVVVYTSGTAPNPLPLVSSYVTVNGSTYQSAVVTAGLSAVNAISGGTVYLNVTRNAFASFASGNVAATGEILDRALQSDQAVISAFIDSLDTQSAASGVVSRLAALDPGVYADLGNVGLDRLRDVQAGLANHIDMLALDTVGESTLSLAVKPGQSTAAAAIEQSRAWTTAYGGWGKRNADSAIGSAGYSSNHFGDISGVETKVGGLTLGILGAVGSTSATFESGRGKLTSDSWHAGFYGNLPAGAFVLDASFAYGQSEGNLKRSVNVAGGGATTGKTQGTEWTGQVGVAVPFRTESGSLVITPSLHLIHANVKQDGLTESSLNGLEAVVKGSTTKSTAVRTGVQAAKITKLANKTTRLTASLDWVHSFDSGTSDVDIALQGAGATTSRFQGSRSSKDAIRIGLGAEIALTERTRFRLNVDEQIRSGMQSTFGSASLGFQF